MKPFQFSIILFLIWLAFGGTISLFVYAHEQAHKDVYKSYDIDSSIKYNLNPFKKTFYTEDWAGMTTTTSNNINNCDSGCNQVHAEIEVLSNMMMFLITISFAYLTIKISLAYWNS
jgi:hypothetical protein